MSCNLLRRGQHQSQGTCRRSAGTHVNRTVTRCLLHYKKPIPQANATIQNAEIGRRQIVSWMTASMLLPLVPGKLKPAVCNCTLQQTNSNSGDVHNSQACVADSSHILVCTTNTVLWLLWICTAVANAAPSIEILNDEPGFGSHPARTGDLVMIHYVGVSLLALRACYYDCMLHSYSQHLLTATALTTIVHHRHHQRRGYCV